jgi:hypothetical protein
MTVNPTLSSLTISVMEVSSKQAEGADTVYEQWSVLSNPKTLAE